MSFSARPGEPLRQTARVVLTAQDPFLCAAEDCKEVATIIHCDAPYCGKHTLEIWGCEGYAQSKVKKRPR